MTSQQTDAFQRQVLDLGRAELSKLLDVWLAESAAKDMNSRASLSEIIGRAFYHGMKFREQIDQKRGEL